MSGSTASSPSSSPIWLYSYIKLRFFNRIRRFLRSKNNNRKRNTTSSDPHLFDTSSSRPVKVMVKESSGVGDVEDEGLGLQRAVKKLHFGSWEEKELAAEEIRTLAKDDVKVSKLVGGLGVIPVLVSMAASDVVDRRRVAVFALIQLANGTYT